MCNYFNNFTDNVCCPTTIWMCNEADNECFFHNSDIKSDKKPCVKCYYCLSPFAMIKDLFCLPFNCIGEYICKYDVGTIETEMSEYYTSNNNINECNVSDILNTSDEDSDIDSDN